MMNKELFVGRLNIVQCNDSLFLYSPCCKARVYYRGAQVGGRYKTECQKCHAQMPSPIGPLDIAVYCVLNDGSSVKDVRWWISQWTGVPEEYLEVSIDD